MAFRKWRTDQAERIAAPAKVANPGCYPTGAIGLLRPLVEAGLIPPDYPISINAVSGYSGGGKSMIEAHDRDGGPAFELYALGLEHKHVAETQLYSGLTRRPIFVPSVGHFRQGMLVSVPLHLDDLPGQPRGADLHDALAAFYDGCDYVRVAEPAADGKLEPQALNDTNRLELRVFANETAPPGGAGRAARQSRQGRVGRGGAEPVADAGAGPGLTVRVPCAGGLARRGGLRYMPAAPDFTLPAGEFPARARNDIEGGR